MEIKQQIIEYRNTHKEARVLLGVVLGEISKLEKEPKRTTTEATDAECINIIKKLIASNIECNELEENKILEIFLPQQLTPMEVIVILNQQNFPNLGECMKWFKLNKVGLYEGKMVTELYKNTEKWQN